MKRREYYVRIIVNEVKIKKVIIDPHFETKHAKSITDEIILQLVQTLDGQIVEAEDMDPPYSYYVRDRIELDGKFYKLIWLLEDKQMYIGVVNAYRR